MVGGASHKLVEAEAEHFKRCGINIEKGAVCTLKECALRHIVEHLLVLAEKLSHKCALVGMERSYKLVQNTNCFQVFKSTLKETYVDK